MSYSTDNFLFDVIVLVATLQSATPKQQSQLVDDKDSDNQFSISSTGTKEENGGQKTIKTSTTTS